MIGAILFGHEEIKKIVAFIEGIQAEIGKEKIVPNIYHAETAIKLPQLKHHCKILLGKVVLKVCQSNGKQEYLCRLGVPLSF